MKFTSEIALFAISSAFVIFSPAFVNGASISVANAKNTLEWNHLSKRATADTKPTETKNDTVVINLVEPEHQSDDQALSPSNDRTVDWELLGGNPDNLNEELTERRRRRSVVATRVANKLESVRQKTEDENRLRTKRDLYRIYDDNRNYDGEDDIDNSGNLELTEKDLENLEKLIRQIQSLNQRENVNEADDDDDDNNDDDGGIDVNDLAYGEDGTSYFEPDAISSNDDVDDENLPLVVQLPEPEQQSDDDDEDEDEVVDDRDFGSKDKRAYPVSRYDDVDDQRPDDDYWVSPSSTIDDNSDINESENDDVLDSDESIPSYLIDDDDEEEARGIRLDTLKRRIKELAQYINDNYRRR